MIFVNNPEDITDREGLAVFGPDEGYRILDEDEVLEPDYGNRGYLILRGPVRESIDTCSFSLFSRYQEEWDGGVWLAARMFPLEKYWQEMVFDLPTILKFEADRTQGVSIAESNEKPLGNRERHTLLAISAALCKEAKLDYAKHAKTAGLILSTAAGMGISIGESTIEGHLKKIPDALATRMK